MFRLIVIIALASAAGAVFGQAPIDIGSRLELFVDRLLVDRLSNTALRMHEPVPREVAITFDKPWEGPFTAYVTVLHHDGRYRMYYRGLPENNADGSTAETTCVAESRDGIHWTRPSLRLFTVRGAARNNVVLAGMAPFSHNFSPFIDTRPGCPANERYKAVAGTVDTGLYGFASADGIHWRKLGETPLLRHGAFDSQNVAFWSEGEGRYVVYYRTWSGGEFSGFRTISRATSPDFAAWKEEGAMGFGDTPMEHLYTSQTNPYFRAPHLYIATPMRFVPGRKVLTDAQAAALGVEKGYAGDAAEAVLMSSRGGTTYTRLFMEAFIRPGPDPGNWASRAGLSALGIVPTSPTEISIYKQEHYAQKSCKLVRYVLRTDGFASVNAPYAGGEMVTRPITFSGKELVVNLSTGATGGVRVEIQDAQGEPIPGFSLADSVEQAGDEIERVVRWKAGADVATLAGRPVRLRFVMHDADLYSIRFR